MADHPHAIDLGDLGNLGENSHEVMRVWVTNNAGSSVWIDPRLLDPRIFGYLVADTVRHAANAYSDDSDVDPRAALQAIVDGLVEQLHEQVLESTALKPGSLN